MQYTISMVWDIKFSRRAEKQIRRVSERILLVLQVLVEDLKNQGPAPGKQWPNYSKLRGNKREDKRHCHLIKGNPTYVCCWQVNKPDKLIEVYYVGTHKQAPY